MMIRAYSEDYLNNAQKILGDMMDYAVNTYELSPNQFYEMFLVSDVSMQFQTGNPTYLYQRSSFSPHEQSITS